MTTSREKQSREPAAPAPARALDRDGASLEQAHRRLQHLYEVSKLLTGFDSVETTVPAVIAAVTQTLSLRSAIFMLETRGPPRTIVWQAEGEPAARLRTAKAHARTSYSYLVGSAAAGSALHDPSEIVEQPATVERQNFVILPLAIAHRPSFGALQLESAGQLDEMDLVFVNAVINQLSVALDRQATIEARHVATEARRRNAEHGQVAAEAGRAQAERMQVAAQVQRVEAERNRDAEEQRRTAAEALQERYEALVDNIDHAFVWEADARTLQVSYVSARAEMLLGHPRARWLGSSDLWTACVHPEDRDAVAETFRTAFIERKDQRCDHRCVTAEGRVLWFHTGIHVTQTDAAPQFQGVSVDITTARQAEDKLRASEERYRALFDFAPMAVFVCDRDGIIETSNRHAVELWGREPAYGVERHCGSTKLFLPDGSLLPHAESPMVDVLRTGLPATNVEVFIARPDGSRIPVIVNFAALKGARGEITGVITSFIDITERMKAEAAVREAGERFRALVDASAQIVWTTTAGGAVVEDSPSWRRFTGQTYEEWRGHGWLDALHPEDRERTAAVWDEAVARGLPLETEYRLRHVSGAWRTTVVRAVPLKQPAGSVRMWIGMNTDVTESRRGERAAAFLAELVRSSPDAIVTKTLEGVITTWNDGAERVFGYAANEIVGQPITIIIPDDRRAEETQILDTVARGERIEHFETVRKRQDGSLIDISLTVSPVRDQSGHIIGISMIARDVTEQKRDERALREAVEQAQQAMRAREELLAIVSHDLKSPLGTILMAADLIERAPEGDDGTHSRTQIERIRRSAERMNRLIQDLLDTASIDAGKLTVELRRLSVAQPARDAVEAMEPLAAIKSLRLACELPSDLPEVLADVGRLQQVFANLVGNAIKFTPEGGTITVRAEISGDDVLFSVADTGSGIPEESVPHLFERFWQARRTARQGTGLGLSIVEGIVVAHGGRIWVDSRIGAGSTFFFTLPRAPIRPVE